MPEPSASTSFGIMLEEVTRHTAARDSLPAGVMPVSTAPKNLVRPRAAHRLFSVVVRSDVEPYDPESPMFAFSWGRVSRERIYTTLATVHAAG